jgi:molecular chaperone GrpE
MAEKKKKKISLLKKYEKLKNEYLACWQRERADFINYKKNELTRMGELMSYSNIDLILKILPILDNFELVENKLPEQLKNDKNIKGLLQIKVQIKDFLKNQKIEEIKSIGKKFDPNFHEVIGEVQVRGKEQGIIVEEIQKGYKFNERIIRIAKVRVAK